MKIYFDNYFRTSKIFREIKITAYLFLQFTTRKLQTIRKKGKLERE